MEQRLENSTLIALRELRSHEQERRLAERHKREEEARQARERKEQERHAEESARERALENQLRIDLQRAQEELKRLRMEADQRAHEASRAKQSLPSITSIPASLAPTPPARRGRLAWGCTAILASALVLLIGVRRDGSVPAKPPRPDLSCPEPVLPVPPPTALTVASKIPVTTPHAAASKTMEGAPGRQRWPVPHPRGAAANHAAGKPNAHRPVCDGTDPLCGLDFRSNAP